MQKPPAARPVTKEPVPKPPAPTPTQQQQENEQFCAQNPGDPSCSKDQPPTQQQENEQFCAQNPSDPSCSKDSAQPPPPTEKICAANPKYPGCAAPGAQPDLTPPSEETQVPGICAQNPQLPICQARPVEAGESPPPPETPPPPPGGGLLPPGPPPPPPQPPADAGAAPPAPTGPQIQTVTECPEGQNLYNGACIHTVCPDGTYRTDALTCVAQCPDGTTATPGIGSEPHCAPQCPQGQFVEFTRCVAQCNAGYPVQQDGVCLPACPDGQVQSGNQCVAACPDGQLVNAVANSCVAACPDGTAELDGMCQLVQDTGCIGGQVLLDGQCVPFDECYQGGAAGRVVHEGICRNSCPGNLNELGSMCLEECPDEPWFEQNGRCRIYCPPDASGPEWYFGACATCPSGSIYFQNQCLNACPANYTEAGGRCEFAGLPCPGGQMMVNGVCTSDPPYDVVVDMCRENIAGGADVPPGMAGLSPREICESLVDASCEALGTDSDAGQATLMCTERPCADGLVNVNGLCRPPGDQPPPVAGDQPPQNGALPPPQNGAQPPPQDGAQPPPQNGVLPPPQDGAQPPPQDGAQPPPQNGAQPPPQNGALPPQDGALPPPAPPPTTALPPPAPPTTIAPTPPPSGASPRPPAAVHAAVRARLAASPPLAVVLSSARFRVKGVPNRLHPAAGADAFMRFLQDDLALARSRIIRLNDPRRRDLDDLFGRPGAPDGHLKAMLADLRPSEVIVYYAGYGLSVDGGRDAVLLASDSDPADAAATGFRLSTMYRNLRALGVRRLRVYLDASFQPTPGALPAVTGAASGAPPAAVASHPAEGPAALLVPPRWVVVTAGTGSEPTLEDPRQPVSAFNAALIAALRGLADAGGNRDGAVTAGELIASLRAQVATALALASRTGQTPALSGPPHEVLLLYRGAPPALPSSSPRLRKQARAAPAPPPASLPVPAKPVKPSFDCATARQAAEKAICADAVLARLDLEMVDLYIARRRALKGARLSTLRRQQLEWLGERNACRVDVACLTAIYRQRIRELQ